MKIMKAIADIIRTCLGPRSMLKMLMDPMGGIVMTNDGNAILREINVQHPAAKSMIEVARTQDEEVGDGTTSVIILAGEMLSVAGPFLEQQMHPTVLIAAFRKALDDMSEILRNNISSPVDVNNRNEMLKIIKSAVGTKFISKWSDLACNIALDATSTVALEENGRKEIDIKRYAKVEKIPGGTIDDSVVLDGVMLNKDVVHPKMKRRIENPRIMLLDCNLEYKKGESQIDQLVSTLIKCWKTQLKGNSNIIFFAHMNETLDQTNIEISQEEDFAKILRMEEDYIQKICDEVTRLKPDLVITEKGVSDLAQHFLIKAGISVIRRVRKSDNNRIARACGATVASRTDELKEEDIGTQCGLFEIQKIGDEYFTYLTKCKDPKACTILLRGASKDILMEVERNLQDAMNVARNVMVDPLLVPGGGASEMALAQELNEKAKSITGVNQWPYRAVARALEIIPRTLIQNCGANTIRTITALRAKHAQPNNVSWGVNGETGVLVDMKEYGVWEPYSVKVQTLKTSLETAILLLRIDDIVSGTKKQGGDGGGPQPDAAPRNPEPE